MRGISMKFLAAVGKLSQNRLHGKKPPPKLRGMHPKKKVYTLASDRNPANQPLLITTQFLYFTYKEF